MNIPRSWGYPIGALRQMDHAGKVADEFDFEAALCGRPQDHLINQRADDFDRLGARGLLLQEGLQAPRPCAGRRRRDWDGAVPAHPQVPPSLPRLGFCVLQTLRAWPEQSGHADPQRNGVEEIIDPTIEIPLFPRERFAPAIAVVAASIGLLIEGSDELFDEIGRHQLALQSVDNPGLDFASTNARAIDAGPLSSTSGAGDIILAD